MQQKVSDWRPLDAPRSSLAEVGLFSAALFAFALLVFAVAWGMMGPASTTAAVAAFVVCWLVSLVSLVACRGARAILHQVGIAMMIRLVGLLLVCLLVRWRYEYLIDGGFVFFLLAFYLAGLVLETVLLLGRVSTVAHKSVTTNG